MGKGEADLFSGDVVQKDSHSFSSLATGELGSQLNMQLMSYLLVFKDRPVLR